MAKLGQLTEREIPDLWGDITYTDEAWGNWTGSITTSGTSTNVIWVTWAGDTGTTSTSVNITIQNEAWGNWAPAAFDRSAQLKLRITRQRELRPIREKAKELLRSILSEEQWADWRRYNSVRLRGSEGGLYEIGCGWAGMIYRLDRVTEQPIDKLCCHPPSHFPVEDRVATLVLALQSDEEAILLKANKHHFGEEEKRRVAARRAHRRAG